MTSKRTTREIGELVFDGRYRVEKVFSNKGMANVYLCMDTTLNKLVVLKEILRSQSGQDHVEYYSLINEAQILSELSHPGIPRIIAMEGVNPPQDHVSVLMDFVEGYDFLKVLRESKTSLDERTVVDRMLVVADIIQYLHTRPYPILYRDIKPDNIQISETSTSLLDYGISLKLIHQGQTLGQALGTRGYAPPELSNGNNIADLRSDIYSFGVTMFQLLTGVDPRKIFPAQNGGTTHVVKGETHATTYDVLFYRPDISSGLAKIILTCTDRDINNRYDSISDLIGDLSNYHHLDNEYQKGIRRKKRTIIGAYAVAAALALGAGGAFLAGQNLQSVRYEEAMRDAEISNSPSDYSEALKISPTNLDGYYPMLQAIQSDGEFTPEEEMDLLSVIQPNASDIRTTEGYPELAYEIGKTYWFFYEGNTSGETLSQPWFNDAMMSTEYRDDATVFYNLAEFSSSINAAVRTASDAGMYLAYWNNLTGAVPLAQGEVLELQLYNRLADCIINYSYRLRVDGVTEQQINEVVAQIQEYTSTVAPSSEVSVELHESLNTKLAEIPSVVDYAFNSMGGDS